MIRPVSKLCGVSYRLLVKPVLFRFDPEAVHDGVSGFAARFGRYAFFRRLTKSTFAFEDASLSQVVAGIKFKNPVGLAGGFDKNAELMPALSRLGFGFLEVGSITARPAAGNAKPRLWRLPKSRALRVNYGLKSDGVEQVAARLENFLNQKTSVKVGTNIAVTNTQDIVSVEDAIADYAESFKRLAALGDYFTVNISCPNRLGHDLFWDASNLEALLAALRRISTAKPIFIKLPPDLSDHELDGIVAAARVHGVHGFICSNLTQNRGQLSSPEEMAAGPGGLSGKAVEKLSEELIAKIYRRSGKDFAIIGCGGIFSAEDAYRKIRLGASLVQVITGLIFQGPQLPGEINRGLAALLKRDGFSSIAEAVGAEHR